MFFRERKRKKEKEEVMDRIDRLFKQFKFNSKDGLETLSIETIEFYLGELKTLSKKIQISADDGTITDFKNEIRYQYMRIFAVYDNNSINATHLDDIPKAVDKVRDTFLESINNAHQYFGSFIEGDFCFRMEVSEQFMPHSIEEIKLRLKKEDWYSYTIRIGFPQPPYKERFNKILQTAINNYINDFLNL